MAPNVKILLHYPQYKLLYGGRGSSNARAGGEPRGARREVEGGADRPQAEALSLRERVEALPAIEADLRGVLDCRGALGYG